MIPEQYMLVMDDIGCGVPAFVVGYIPQRSDIIISTHSTRVWGPDMAMKIKAGLQENEKWHRITWADEEIDEAARHGFDGMPKGGWRMLPAFPESAVIHEETAAAELGQYTTGQDDH